MASYILRRILLMISQFIAYFNFSNMPTIAAVKMADALESADIGALWLLIGFVLVVMVGQTVRTMQGAGWLPIHSLDLDEEHWRVSMR